VPVISRRILLELDDGRKKPAWIQTYYLEVESVPVRVSDKCGIGTREQDTKSSKIRYVKRNKPEGVKRRRRKREKKKKKKKGEKRKRKKEKKKKKKKKENQKKRKY